MFQHEFSESEELTRISIQLRGLVSLCENWKRSLSRFSKQPRAFSPGPKDAHQEDDEACPGGVRPEGEAALVGIRLGERGDGGDYAGDVGGIEHLTAGELSDFFEDIETGGAASFLAGGSEHRNARFKRRAGR